MKLPVVILLFFLGLTKSSKPAPRREIQGPVPISSSSNQSKEGSSVDGQGWPDADCGTSLGPISPDDEVRKLPPREGEFPWMVFLTAKDADKTWTCSGSIILDDVILTAASCVNGIKRDTIKIEAGIVDVITKGPYHQKRKAKKIIVHEKYSQDPRHDIAIVQLKKPFYFDKSEGVIGTVCIPGTSKELGGNVTVVGWPSIRMLSECACEEIGKISSFLRAVDVTANQDCGNSFTIAHDAKLTFCVRICKETSCPLQVVGIGGAAVQKPEVVSVQVGIATGGAGFDATPEYYVKLSYFQDWIRKKLKFLKGETYER